MILLLRLLLVVHLLQLLLLGGFSFHLVSLQHRHRLLHLVKRYLNCIPPKYPSNNTGCANFVSKVDRKTVYMYLSLQAGRVLKHVKKLRVVDLEQHPGDLSGEVRVLALKKAKSEQFNETSLSCALATWMRGKRRSPSICFCSCIGAAASIAVVSGSWILNNKSLNSCIFHLSWHNNAALLSAGLHRTWRLPTLRWQRVSSLLKKSRLRVSTR